MADEWIGRTPETSSPYYPFIKAIEGNTMAGVENLTYILRRYLMDMPSAGYTPPSDNVYPRARLKKYLYWDCPLPLEQPLPTAAQMKSIVFDPEKPADPPDVERGYRIFSQSVVQQAQRNAQTVLKIEPYNISRAYEGNTFRLRQYIHYTIMVNYAVESNTGTTVQSRASGILQAIIEATEGVSLGDGSIGGIVTDRAERFDDKYTNVGYHLFQYIDWLTDGPNHWYGGN